MALPQRPPPAPPAGEHADQVALVLDRAVRVLDRLGGVGDQLARSLERVVELADRGAAEQLLRRRRPRRPHPRRADREPHVGQPLAVEPQVAGDRDRRALVEDELAVDDRRPGRERRDQHRGQQLALLERVLERPAHELADPDPARLAAAAPRLERGVHREQERRRVRMRVGEAEVAADRAHRPHAQVADPALHRRQRRPLGAHGRVALDRAVGLRGADPQHPVAALDPAQLVDRLEVDHVRVVGEAELEEQEQLGAADVGDRVVAVALEQLGGLLDASSGGGARTAAARSRRRTQPSRLSESTRSAASAPAARSTSTPRSANPRPNADTATTGYSDRDPGPMCPSRNSRSVSSP